MKYIYKIVVNKKLHSFSDDSYAVVESKVAELLRKNNINFSFEEIKKQILRQSAISTKPKKPTIGEAFLGAKALIEYTAGNSASNQEVERRASICRSCPNLDKASGCMACGASRNAANLINQIRTHKKTEMPLPSDLKDKYCGICSCSISLLIVTRHADFRYESDKKNARRPDHCWIKRSSENFTQE